MHTIVGKASFDEKAIVENLSTLLDAIVRAKPSAAKGTYLQIDHADLDDGAGREGRSDPRSSDRDHRVTPAGTRDYTA